MFAVPTCRSVACVLFVHCDEARVTHMFPDPVLPSVDLALFNLQDFAARGEDVVACMIRIPPRRRRRRGP